jgi:hypothetical protein
MYQIKSNQMQIWQIKNQTKQNQSKAFFVSHNPVFAMSRARRVPTVQ